jgi:hypothetical protein
MLEDGGTRLLGERSATCPNRDSCMSGIFRKLRYIQRNIITPNVPTNIQLITPAPRNMVMIHVSRGRQIAVLEEETHNECRGWPIRPRQYNQSAPPILKVPKVAAITCSAKTSNNQDLLVDLRHSDRPGLRLPALGFGLSFTLQFSSARWYLREPTGVLVC